MEKNKAKAVLEAILFTMGDSVEIDRLAAVIEEDKDTTRRFLEETYSVLGESESYIRKRIGGSVLRRWITRCRCAPKANYTST